MAAPVCQFVDRVGSTGSVQRLNLNDDKNFRLLLGPDFKGPDFSPPPLKRAVVNTLLAEGAAIPASAYDNRVIRLPLQVTACDETEMATTLESLHRELDRGNNVLKWHPTYNSKPVYFRTFRSPDYRLDQTFEGRAELRITLSLLAEPFAYGDYEEETGTINNDPAAVANPISFQIVATDGDVPTPLFLRCGTAFCEAILVAARRHGTPVLYFRQCEAMTQGTDTTTQPNDALMSGAGNNYSRTTFATAAWSERLRWVNAPAAGSDDDYRGLYRVFARVRATGTNTIEVRMIVGPTGAIYYTDPVLVTHMGPYLMDLGLVALPTGSDPIYDGYSGTPLPAANARIIFEARRLSGTATLDWDYVVLVPADEELAITDPAPTTTPIFDGPNDIAYAGDLTQVLGQGPMPLIGSIPLVSPNQTNLYVVLLGITVNTLASTMAYTARYWPRYLYIR